MTPDPEEAALTADRGHQVDGSPQVYTCNEYRQEMILLALRRKLLLADLKEEERRHLAGEIARLEKELGM
jgi:hypothetical protein